MLPLHDRALDELLAHVRTTYAPLGVVVSGSIVRGEAGPTSDFDVFVVHEHPWRQRVQRRFSGVPAELFINPPATVRRYFATEHAEGRPSTAHMFATGRVIEPSSAVVHELVAEAKAWLARPVEVTEAQLTQRRYAAVDRLDDARDTVASDATMTRLLLADVVRQIVAYAFWSRRRVQPRTKQTVTALRALDPGAAELVDGWAVAGSAEDALAAVVALAGHVLGVDTFFAWESARDG